MCTAEQLGLDEYVCFSPCQSHYKTSYIFNYIVFARFSCTVSITFAQRVLGGYPLIVSLFCISGVAEKKNYAVWLFCHSEQTLSNWKQWNRWTQQILHAIYIMSFDQSHSCREINIWAGLFDFSLNRFFYLIREKKENCHDFLWRTNCFFEAQLFCIPKFGWLSEHKWFQLNAQKIIHWNVDLLKVYKKFATTGHANRPCDIHIKRNQRWKNKFRIFIIYILHLILKGFKNTVNEFAYFDQLPVIKYTGRQTDEHSILHIIDVIAFRFDV